jgi:dTDP-4-amino-4,6-dideoxygalactose transaminase
VLRVKRWDELKKYLSDARIGTEVYYPIPLHMQACFDYLGHGAEDCPESYRAAGETLAISIYAELSDVQKGWVIETIASFYTLVS